MSPKMIDGTASVQSYMVCAQDGKFVLAIRPYGIGLKNVDGVLTPLASYRFRVAPVDYGSERVIALGSQSIQAAFPDFPHEKLNDERKSALFTTPVTIDMENVDDMSAIIGQVVDQLFEEITKQAGDHLVIDKDTLIEFVANDLDQHLSGFVLNKIKENLAQDAYKTPGFAHEKINKGLEEKVKTMPQKFKDLIKPKPTAEPVDEDALPAPTKGKAKEVSEEPNVLNLMAAMKAKYENAPGDE